MQVPQSNPLLNSEAENYNPSSSSSCFWNIRFFLSSSIKNSLNCSSSSSSSSTSPCSLSSSSSLSIYCSTYSTSCIWRSASQAELYRVGISSFRFSISFITSSTGPEFYSFSMICSCSLTCLSMLSRLFVINSSWFTIFYSSNDINSAIF